MSNEKRVFVVLGTQKFQMNRLLIKIDEIAKKNDNLKFLAQTGHSNYKPIRYAYQNFFNEIEFKKNIRECDLLITHAGIGTIITGLEYSKKILVFPRRAEYHEHVDNHQCEIAKAFEEKNYLLNCKNANELEKKIIECINSNFNEYHPNANNINRYIDEYIAEGINEK